LPEETVRFQVVLFESSSDILFNYADTVFGGSAAWTDYRAWVQVQVAPGVTTSFSTGEPSLNDNVALLWTTTGPNLTNSVPSITSLSPSSAPVAADFTLVVNGSNFIDSSVVRWNGSNRPTTFMNSGQLSAQISAANLSPGISTVTVLTFAGGISKTANFTTGLDTRHRPTRPPSRTPIAQASAVASNTPQSSTDAVLPPATMSAPLFNVLVPITVAVDETEDAETTDDERREKQP
jgi:hypothetical protein